MGSCVNVLVPPCSPPLLPQNLSCMASRKGEVETLGRATFLLQKVGHPFSEVQSHHGHVRGHVWRLSTASTRVLHGLQRDLKHACAWACCLANRVTHGLWLTKHLLLMSGKRWAGGDGAVRAVGWCPALWSLTFSGSGNRNRINW